MKHTRRLLGILLAAGLGLQTAAAREDFRVLSSPEDVREVLREAQWLMLPQKGAAEMEGGRHWFVPENAQAEAFVWSLLRGQGIDAHVRVSEDAATRETVFEDVDGAEVERLQAEEGYQPAWVLEWLAPEGVPEGMAPEDYDPSRVSVLLQLVPLFLEMGAPREGGTVFLKPLDAGLEVAGGEAGGAGGEGVDAGNVVELPLSGGTNDVLAAVEPAPRIVYVDAMRGDDGWTGKQRVFSKGSEGPKRSVAAGMAALEEGGGLIIQEGIYAESLDVRGRNVVVYFQGNVVLKQRTRTPVQFVPDAAMETNNVVKVNQ